MLEFAVDGLVVVGVGLWADVSSGVATEVAVLPLTVVSNADRNTDHRCLCLSDVHSKLRGGSSRMWLRAMDYADVDLDVPGPVVMSARQQNPTFKILYTGLKAHLVT